MAKPAEKTGYVEEISGKLKHGLAVHKVLFHPRQIEKSQVLCRLVTTGSNDPSVVASVHVLEHKMPRRAGCNKCWWLVKPLNPSRMSSLPRRDLAISMQFLGWNHPKTEESGFRSPVVGWKSTTVFGSGGLCIPQDMSPGSLHHFFCWWAYAA